MISVSSVKELMDTHDWYYEYSDDHGEWTRGLYQRVVIIRVLQKLPLKDVAELMKLVPGDLRASWELDLVRLK